MLLYLCTTCGRWQDVTLAKQLNELAEKLTLAFNGKPVEPLPGYACPAGCGLMEQVQPGDRLARRTAESISETEALAPQILAWIERVRGESMRDVNETRCVDRLDVLVDDIEELCQKQVLGEEQKI